MVIRSTRSVCPVCLKNIPAQLDQTEDGSVFLQKTCPEHGRFQVPIWRENLDFLNWCQFANPLDEKQGLSCPGNCGICPEHEIGSCCVLLEVTNRCNLHCRFCFANGGCEQNDPSLAELKNSIYDIIRQCGHPLLQLSGGEPTLRDDLPDIIRIAKQAGCSYVQLNTNGIRLAEEPEYAVKLADAGLDIVFLQFDGTNDEIFTYLRGMPLLDVKLKAIQICSDLQIGVTLVPTVVKGINDQDLGNLITLAQNMVPGVRGIHFQPVSYFGRYSDPPGPDDRYTLDQLMSDISNQAGIPITCFQPSRCDHPLCGFHVCCLTEADGRLRPLSTHSSGTRGCAKDNREYVARHWIRQPPENKPDISQEMDFDTFLYRIRQESLTLSAMAFQDAMNLNIERLHRCSLHVYGNRTVKPFCANYLTPIL